MFFRWVTTSRIRGRRPVSRGWPRDGWTGRPPRTRRGQAPRWAYSRRPALRSSAPKRAEARRYQPCQLPAAARLAVGPFLSLDPLGVQLDRGRNPLRSERSGDRLAADLLRTRPAVCHLERRPSVDRRPATAHERQDSVVGQEALRG